MNKKAAISKELDAKHVKMLEGLLKLPENRECADCKNKAPRWASINLGIFICLQCSGIHRSLGVHISKVRSATLDTWLPEQVVFMQRIGNEKANAYWEAELPDNYDRSRFENFIRAKYVDKLWVPRDGKGKSSPTSEGKLPSSPSSRSDSSSSITDFLANQKLEIKKISLVEKQASSREEPASAHSLENTTTNQRVERKECLIAGDREADYGNAEVLKDDAEDQTPEAGPDPDPGSQKDVQSTKPAVSRDYSDKPNVVPVIPSPKVDYGTELFRLLCVDDFTESDCSPLSDESTWVDFDTDEEDTTLGKAVGRSLASKVHPEPKIDDVRISIVSEIKIIPQEHQKDATYHNQGNLEELKKASVTAQDGSSLTNTTGITYHGSFDGINNFPGTQLQMLNIPTPKFAAYTTPHTTSSLNKPAVPLSGLSKTPTKTHPAALPVSGFDYDFSFLTQGMFTK